MKEFRAFSIWITKNEQTKQAENKKQTTMHVTQQSV